MLTSFCSSICSSGAASPSATAAGTSAGVSSFSYFSIKNVRELGYTYLLIKLLELSLLDFACSSFPSWIKLKCFILLF
jgi:hypothetical protein